MNQVPHLLFTAALVVALGLGAVGCTDATPTGPQPVDSRVGIAGLWAGTVGSTPLRLEIHEAPDRSLTGRVILGAEGEARVLAIVETVWSGPTAFTLFLSCEEDCFRTLRGTLLENRLAGDYSETAGDSAGRTEAWQARRLETIAPL